VSDAAAVAVRPARREDVPGVWEMLTGLAAYERLSDQVTGTPERLADLLFGGRDGLRCLVAESAGRLIGYALFHPIYSSFRTSRALWLEDLFVDPARRGTGAGRALLAAVAREAVGLGCRGVSWFVLDWNEPAIGFYRRHGAEPAPPSGWLRYGLEGDALRRLAAGD
jgi:hypothetical protein